MKKTTTRKVIKNSRSYERTVDRPIAITPIEYGGLQEAYDHFNRELFGGVLPDVFITYQRRANSAGYFAPDRFSGRVEKFGRHELALNPDGFLGRNDEWICQTLVHEMTHGWQQHCGTPPSRGYHNREWANKMKAIGLQPSSTGMVGGKETGARMSDYVIPDGPFTKAFAMLAAGGWKLNLQSAHRPGPKGGTNSKTKFSCCASCGMNVWGKPEADTVCRPCLMRALEAAGIHVDEAIIEGVRMRDAGAATVSAPSYEINLPTEQPTEEIKPKRGRPKGSKNKKPEKTASEELTEALSRLETHKRKKQQLQQTGDGEVALETSKAKINRLNLIIWRILEHSPGPDYAQHEEWSDRAFATESEKEWLRSVDRKQPKLGDYYEAKQIEERIIQRRKKKWNERQGVNENKQTNSETGRSIGA